MMPLIKNILENKIVSYSLIFSIFISCVGLFNSSWYSLILYQLLFLLFFSAKINFNKKYWLIVAFLIPITILTKQSLEIPKIIQGSNVFIGGINYNNSMTITHGEKQDFLGVISSLFFRLFSLKQL